jgi:hypothetical protein
VSTPSHGGLALTAEAAQALSPACLRHGARYGGYVFFEEDIDFMFALFELPWLFEKYSNWWGETAEAFHQRCIETFWASGLTGIGIAVTADGQQHLIDLDRYEPHPPSGLNLLCHAEVIVPPGGL